MIGAAIGGREAGVVFEGDRRFPIVVRLPDALRDDLEALKQSPGPASADGGAKRARAPSVPLKQVATFSFAEGPNQISRENGKRRVVVTANVRGRDIASVVARGAGQKSAQQVTLPPGYWLAWGGQFENLAAARAAPRRSSCRSASSLIFLLLLFGARARPATRCSCSAPCRWR